MNAGTIVKDARDRMHKSVEYFERELRGVRTGRANTALIEYIKVEYYGNATDLRELAAVSVPESTKLLVKPFDPSIKSEIAKAIEAADLGLRAQVDADTVRVNVPAPSSERRQQLITQVKKMAEESRVAIRNERRDALKHIDALAKAKDGSLSEDQARTTRDQVEDMTKKHIKAIDDAAAKKTVEIEAV